MNRIKCAVICSVLTFLLICVPLSVANSKPTAIQFKHRLDRADICNHGPIYSEMLQDTSVMEHPAIQKKFVWLAKNVWFERYIKGNMTEISDNKIICESSKRLSGLTGIVFEQYQQLALELEGKPFVEVWIHILPRSGQKIPNRVVARLKQLHPMVIPNLLPKISFNDTDTREEKDLNRQIFQGSIGSFSRVFYETTRFGWEDLNGGMQKRIRKFAWEALTKETTKIPGFKTFAVAFLLDRGNSESKLRNEIVQPPIHSYDEQEIIEFYIDKTFEQANQWRSEYPKWPIDESKLDDSHKNDRGKGHDTQKGQGH